MTNQEAFTTMVQHLRKQGCKSQDEAHQTCLYRGPNGLKCAVGALIPDEEYREEWDRDGKGAMKIQPDCPSLHGLNGWMLFDVQSIHDHNAVSEWEWKFAQIAKRHNLTLPPLEASHAKPLHDPNVLIVGGILLYVLLAITAVMMLAQ